MKADILQSFNDQLRKAGLEVEKIIANGHIYRCGTCERPDRKDGAYKAFMDEPATIWWKNWRTGEEGSWTESRQKDWSVQERKILRDRIEAIKAETRDEQVKRWKAAAKLAKFIWIHGKPADPDHPYLHRKQIPAYGLRQTSDGRLIIPVIGSSGKGESLQFILPVKEPDYPDKLFLKGGRITGGYFLIKSNMEDNGTLLIAEGYATGASLNLATGHPVMIAFTAGNLEAVCRMARERNPEQEIIVCADNDIETRGNPGVVKAKNAAQAITGKLAICPALDGKNTDFNDLHCLRSLDAVKTVISEAKKQNPECPMPEGFCLVPSGKRAGLYKMVIKPDGETSEVRLGPPLFVKGMTRDCEGNDWGLMLEWIDPDNKKHLWAMPVDLLFRQGSDWYSILASGGWLGNPSARKYLVEFFSTVRPLRKIRCVPRTGWDNGVYILPDAVFGDTKGESVVLQSVPYDGLYQTNGSLSEWQEIPRLAAGNSRLSFALCVAFAGPLLRFAMLEGGGFSYEGGSSSGKTTALQIAASVWGSPDHVRSWRATDNGLEIIAMLHNDNALFLDEVGQVNGKVLAECAYMLANGMGKGRSTKDGNLRRSLSWRLLFLSSGELGLADKLAENGLKSRGGQEVRFVGLPIDASMLTELHGFSHPGALINRLKDISAASYGHAGRAFLARLCEPENMELACQKLPFEITSTANSIIPQGADGQVMRVAQRFALCGVAGEFAQKFGILPKEFDAQACAKTCFMDWLTARGNAGASEDAAILATVRLFIEQHGASRFQDLDTGMSNCVNRVGFRREIHGKTEYIILPESFRAEIIRGYSPRRAESVLRKAGWLHISDGKSTTKRELPGMGRIRVYVIILPDDGEEESFIHITSNSGGNMGKVANTAISVTN